MGGKTIKTTFFSEFTIARFACQRVVPILLHIGPPQASTPRSGEADSHQDLGIDGLRCFEGTHIRKPSGNHRKPGISWDDLLSNAPGWDDCLGISWSCWKITYNIGCKFPSYATS